MTDIKVNDKTVAFIADWRERTAKQQKQYTLLTIGAFFIALVICVFLFFWFQNVNYERIVDRNMRYIQDSALQETNQLENDLYHAKTLVVNLANQYANLTELMKESTVKEKLSMLKDANLFDRIAFISADGTDTSLEGVTNVSDREYFKRAMQGESGWEAIEHSMITGLPTVVFYAPIISNGTMIGIMAGFYEQERLDNLFSYQLFNFMPETYLLLGDGTTIASSDIESVNTNMLLQLSEKNYSGEVDFSDIREAIDDTARTSISFSFKDNRQTSVGVIVQFQDTDWMILSVLPHDITAQMVNKANQIGIILMAAIIALFLLLIFLLIMFFRKQNKKLEYEMSLASASLSETVEKEKKQMAIIESLVNAYSSVYFIDLETHEYQQIKEDIILSRQIPEKGDVQEGFSEYIDKFVDESEKNTMRDFLAAETFKKRLNESASLSIEYQRTNKQWRRGTIVAAGHDAFGEVVSILFAVQKIDQEKKIELQTQKALQDAYEAAQIANNAKTTFLSNMSHDIRTPLNAIIGMTTIAAANLTNTDKVSDCLKKITTSGKHLLGLINEILDMSKIESGKVDLTEEEFRLSDLIDNLIALHQPLIKAKNHTLIVKVGNLEHENVIGDSTRLQQVFSNLLSNAIKYTPDGGEIQILLTEKNTNKSTVGWYEVVFKDNGIGIAEEFQETLFDPFTRASDVRVSDIQGTGLGMPIARNIIHMMNGDITVKSKINKGSEFTVSFALKLHADEQADYSGFIGLPILVVDDDISSCECTCAILNSLSMKSEWVTTGKEAVQKTLEQHNAGNDYYALIVDWKMPNMDGIETTKEIRQKVGDDITIIVLSAYDWAEIEQKAREAGANAFLSKPLFKSRVVDLFGELVGNKKKDSGNLTEEIKKHDFSGHRVLLAEDNEINREMMSELLSMIGIETECVENGKLCVDKFAESEPGYYDLIFMDIQMPVMNGYDATAAIRVLQHPNAKKIPIIAMSANAFSSDVRNAYEVGMNGHVSKPIDMKNVIRALEEHIPK